jgi:hypothetical protein
MELEPFDLWGSGTWCNQEVVGESHHLPELRKLFGHGSGRPRDLECSALLVPEPDNKFDSAAVAVQIDGRTVGHLPREIAGSYRACLADLTARGQVARVRCRTWAGMETDYETNRAGRLVEKERFTASVTIALAEPHLCTPVNVRPMDPYTLLPDGVAIQISGEERCMSAIEPHLRPEGEGYVYATLHEFADTSTRTAKELVEVRIDGLRVGQLTPKMSGDLLPAIRHLDERGLLTAVKAKVKGNRLKAEITIHGAKAHELPADWPGGVVVPQAAMPVPNDPVRHAAAVEPAVPAMVPSAPLSSAHAPVPPKPTRIRFVPAPGWPPPPDGWEPPPGWLPDPTWPTAPPGWQFWVME